MDKSTAKNNVQAMEYVKRTASATVITFIKENHAESTAVAITMMLIFVEESSQSTLIHLMKMKTEIVKVKKVIWRRMTKSHKNIIKNIMY